MWKYFVHAGVVTVFWFIVALPSYADDILRINLSPRYVGHGAVTLDATLTNGSLNPITIRSVDPADGQKGHSGEGDYYIYASDDLGRTPLLTQEGKLLYAGPDLFAFGVRRAVILRPGESTKVQIEVGYIYDLSHPGQYRFWVGRKVDTMSGTRFLRSNEVTVEVPG